MFYAQSASTVMVGRGGGAGEGGRGPSSDSENLCKVSLVCPFCWGFSCIQLMGFLPSTLAFPFIPWVVWNSMLFLPFPRSDLNYAAPFFSFFLFQRAISNMYSKIQPLPPPPPLSLSLSLSLLHHLIYSCLPTEPESALSVLRNVDSCCRQIKNMNDEKQTEVQ